MTNPRLAAILAWMRSGSRTVLLLLAGAGLALAAVGAIWLRWRQNTPLQKPDSGLGGNLPSSERAFSESYLDPVAGRPGQQRTECAACHLGPKGFSRPLWDFLTARAALSRQAWADAIPLGGTCAVCHIAPDPAMLPEQSWEQVFPRMDALRAQRKVAALTGYQRQDVFHYYFTYSRARQPRLTPDPDPALSPIQFDAAEFGRRMSTNRRERPILGHVQIADLDHDGQPDVLVADTDQSQVTWIHRPKPGGQWEEAPLANVPYPTHTQIVTNISNGSWNIVVACQSQLAPTEDPVGTVVLLVNNGHTRFTPVPIAEHLPRLADVEPGDFNGDGQIDFVVAAYGYINAGEVGWLENRGNEKYLYHTIVKRSGAIHVPPADLDGDGRLDFVALFAQEHEQISAFINDGQGGFREQVLFKAATPSFGSSGIQLVDLDQDGDLDILYTNGDNMDLPSTIPRPYHGVQWLENKGNLRFEWHDICRYYGAYCAVAADLNHDGHLDVVVTSLFNDWKDPSRDSLIWLENDGQQHFAAHGIARAPIALVSAAVEDLDGDGEPEIVACSFNAFPQFPTDHIGRITLWKRHEPGHSPGP